MHFRPVKEQNGIRERNEKKKNNVFTENTKNTQQAPANAKNQSKDIIFTRGSNVAIPPCGNNEETNL
jgi:hypothetical protein